MINLFNIPNHTIDTSQFSNLLHDNIVEQFEKSFAEYVGAKYACMGNSASSLLFLALLNKNAKISIPSTIPAVVPNLIINSGNSISFHDDVDWVGNSYRLHENIIDSAQEVSKNQYASLNENDAIMIFSFYPTKPIGSCDGGMVVSNSKDSIDYFRTMTLNGMSFSTDNWKRVQTRAGFKMHSNSIQAFIANENFKKIDEKNKRLSEVRAIYNQEFGYNNCSAHLYRIRVRDNKSFISNIKDNGIYCGIHYEPCHKVKCFGYKGKDLPLSTEEGTKTVSIPFHEKLSDNDIDKVVNNVKELACF